MYIWIASEIKNIHSFITSVWLLLLVAPDCGALWFSDYSTGCQTREHWFGSCAVRLNLGQVCSFYVAPVHAALWMTWS